MSAAPPVAELRPLAGLPRAAVLALNNAHAAETSFLDEEDLARLQVAAFAALAVVGEGGDLGALLIAFDQAADYDSPNFLWFRARYPRFVYVDRVITAPAARGRGLARRLYDELSREAIASAHRMIACEVNLDPPNPVSDAFHAALGFEEVGRAELPDRAKRVRYLVRPLP